MAYFGTAETSASGREGVEEREKGGGDDDGGAADLGARQRWERAGRDEDLWAFTEVLFPEPRLSHHPQAQDTQDEVQKRNLREELEERERRHFTSKEKGYAEDKDRRRGAGLGQLLLEGVKREAEDRLIPCSVDADDSDVEVKSDDERYKVLMVEQHVKINLDALPQLIPFWSTKIISHHLELVKLKNHFQVRRMQQHHLLLRLCRS